MDVLLRYDVRLYFDKDNVGGIYLLRRFYLFRLCDRVKFIVYIGECILDFKIEE